MNLENIKQPYAPPIFGNAQERTEKLTNAEDKFNDLTTKLFVMLKERAEREVPENGKYTPIGVTYSIPQSENVAQCTIEYDPLNPKDSRKLTVGAFRRGSSRIVSTPVLKGTKKEILNYLDNHENVPDVIKMVKELSKSVDDFYLEN